VSPADVGHRIWRSFLVVQICESVRAMGRRKGKQVASCDPEYGIQAVLVDVAQMAHKNITVAARAYKVSAAPLLLNP